MYSHDSCPNVLKIKQLKYSVPEESRVHRIPRFTILPCSSDAFCTPLLTLQTLKKPKQIGHGF